MTDSPRPAYDSLDPQARALVDRWCAELAAESEGTTTTFRFLCAQAAVRFGRLRELRRTELRGKRVAIFADEELEAVYAVEDPGLGG